MFFKNLAQEIKDVTIPLYKILIPFIFIVKFLDEIGVASLPGSVFGFKPNHLIVRLAFTDFNGSIFLKKINVKTNITDELIEKYATKVAIGVKKLAAWIDKQ